MSNVVIKVESLSKQYRLGEVGTGSLKDDFKRWRYKMMGKVDPFLTLGDQNDRTKRSNTDYVWALKDLNFEVKQGEVLGIIGKNGAGKSTLLKILSRTTGPTLGKLKMKGRVASLLEVGTGFHGELSGRENIFLNGAIMGMSKPEIRSKFDEIVDFAGVEKYIDTPVKRYSSGMYVRLAFGVAAHLEPDILIVDEVLAVGDAEFQKKALGKMRDVSHDDGRTILFVSHNMAAVQNLCNNGILLENGMIKATESIDKIISLYQNSSENKHSWEGENGADNLVVTSSKVYAADSTAEIYNNSDIIIEVGFTCTKDFKQLGFGFNLISNYGYPVARANYNDYNDLDGLSKGDYLMKFIIPKYTLASGSYTIDFDIAIPYIKKLCSSEINLSFDVLSRGSNGNKYFFQNLPTYNSLVREDWLKEINVIK